MTRRFGHGILLEPLEPDKADLQALWDEIDRLMGGEEFLPEGRPEQLPMPPAPDFND